MCQEHAARYLPLQEHYCKCWCYRSGRKCHHQILAKIKCGHDEKLPSGKRCCVCYVIVCVPITITEVGLQLDDDAKHCGLYCYYKHNYKITKGHDPVDEHFEANALDTGHHT